MSRQWADMDWRDYLDILVQRRWYIIIPFVLCISASVPLFYLLPKLYKSTTVILIERQKVPESIVKSSVAVSIDERLSTIRQQIMSTSLLRTVIEEFDLYQELSDKKSPDQLAGMMRKNVVVDVDSRGRRINGFSVSFISTDPNAAMLVANKLASLFIEKNLKVREAFIEGTSEFLDSELNQIKAELEIQEDKIREFKQKFIGELSEQTSANLSTLDRLQVERQTVHEALSRAKERQGLLLQTDPSLTPPDLDSAAVNALENMSPVQIRLMQLRSELADLQTRFTDKYPDVIRLKDLISKLETGSGEIPIEFPTGVLEASSPYGLQSQFNQNHIEILGLQQRLAKVESRIRSYEARVENTPLREQQMISLRRDYMNTQKHYQSLLDKRLNARISENLEKRQKGEQFHVLEPANLPLSPFKPDKLRIVLLSIMAGFGIGGGAIFLREMMDSSFRKAEEVEAMFNLSVLASIPTITNTIKQGKHAG